MSALDNDRPSQPDHVAGFNQVENPTSKTSAEESSAREKPSEQSWIAEHRQPHDVPQGHGEDANDSSLASGERGPLTEKLIPESDAQNYAKGDSNLEGEQMRMAGEGEVAHAVRTGGGGGHGEERSLTEGLDRRAEAHEAELQRRGERTGREIEEEEKEDWTGKKADIASALNDGRENRDDENRPAIVLAAEE